MEKIRSRKINKLEIGLILFLNLIWMLLSCTLLPFLFVKFWLSILDKLDNWGYNGYYEHTRVWELNYPKK